MKRIGICINNVIRNHMNTLVHTYEKYMELEEFTTPIEDINPFDLEPWFPMDRSDKDVVEFDPNSPDPYDQIDENASGSTMFDNVEIPNFKTSNEYVKNDEAKDVYELMYTYFSLEVFGRAEVVDPNVFNTLKIINEALNEFGSEIVLVNQESDKSKIATLFFLSKSGFNLNKISFTKTTLDIWNEVDMLITDHPKLIEGKPEGKQVVKVVNKWNANLDSDYTINGIMDVTDENKNSFLFV